MSLFHISKETGKKSKVIYMIFKIQLTSPSLPYSAAFGLATNYLWALAHAVFFFAWNVFFLYPPLVLSLHVLQYLVYLKKYLCIHLFIFLAALGLSCGTRHLCCGMQDLLLWCAGSSLRHAGFSLVVARGLQSAWAL